MFDPFIEKHISYIKKTNSTIFVYKGFPYRFLKIINTIIPRLYNGAYWDSSGFDICKLDSYSKKIKAGLLLKEDDSNAWLLFEEFLILVNSFHDISKEYDGNIIIFENNYFSKLYPIDFHINSIPAINNFINYQESLDVNKSVDNGVQELLQYYGQIEKKFDTYYVSYVDKSEIYNRKVKNTPFFIDYFLIRGKDVNKIEIEDKKSVLIFPDHVNKSFDQFKLLLYKGTNLRDVKNLEIVIEGSVLKDKELLNEVSLFNYVAQKNDFNVIFLLKKPHFKNEFHDQFLFILKKYWGSNSEFRKLIFYKDPDTSLEKIEISQGALINDIVHQVDNAAEDFRYLRDIFVTAPTGSGKSILFQIPAISIALNRNLITIVVTPLKALMQDQVYALKKRGVNFCAYINSDLSLSDRDFIIEQIHKGDVSIIYLSPELLLSNDIRYFIGKRDIGLFVIDEAHLVSTWGRDFRVDYWFLGQYISKLRKYKMTNYFPILALTATAVYQGPEDTVLETVMSLHMHNPKLYLGQVRREDISFNVRDYEPPKGSYDLNKYKQTIELILHTIDTSAKTIMYFPWKRQVEDIWKMIPHESIIKIGKYHGSMLPTEKEDLMLDFKDGRKVVMLATKAFGMGVDIDDIKEIYHHAPSGNLCDYIQEVGRAARRKDIKGVASIDFCVKDLKYTKVLYGLSTLRQYQLRIMLRKLFDIYSLIERQNFLVSPETFAFIFNDDVDIEQKVKSGLLLIENDLINKYGYPAVLVRPRSLFTTGYAMIPNSVIHEFISGRYAETVQRVTNYWNDNIDIKQIPNMDTSKLGDNYEINLRKIWENNYPSLSFPQLKYRFFNKQLFRFDDPDHYGVQVYPRYKLTIELINKPGQIKKRLDDYLSMINNLFSNLIGYFTENDFLNLIKENIKSTSTARRIANAILNIFTISVSEKENQDSTFSSDQFIQRRGYGEEIRYRVINNNFLTIKAETIRQFDRLFSKADERNRIVRYIATSERRTNMSVRLAHMLDAFQLGTYEIAGGKEPELFIRINDPYKIKNLVDNEDYTNLVLADIENRHKRSVAIMEDFFTKSRNNQEKWDLIEQYFLGRDILNQYGDNHL